MMNLSSILTENDCKLLYRFSNAYRPIHGYLSTVVCLLGIPSNILNIIVLTRPNLITSSTNVILTGLAVSDLLTMCTYLPFAIWNNVIYSEPHYCVLKSLTRETILVKNNLFWTYFLDFHVNFSVTVHSISIWLTVYLAFFRFIFIATSPQAITHKKTCCNRMITYLRTYKSTLLMMSLIVLFCVLFCSPSYVLFEVTQVPLRELLPNDTSNTTVYVQRERFANKQDHELAFKITLFTQAFCAKLIPCIILTTFTSLLIRSLIIINANKRKLFNFYSQRQHVSNDDSIEHNFLTQPDTSKKRKSTGTQNHQQQQQLQHRDSRVGNRLSHENLRTTLMLVIVCSLFLITELPQSVLFLLSLDFKSDFYNSVYMPLGDVLDMIALLNNAINFLLYCSMSRAFRETFYSLFKINSACIKWKIVKSSDAFDENNFVRQSSL